MNAQNQTPSNTSWTAQNLKGIPLEKRLDLCPKFLQSVILNAKKELEVQEVWILGSRARGDASPLSDYDLVFDVPESKLSFWPIFVGEQRETVKTLLPVDWILKSQISGKMKDSLQSEGILLYEKQ